MDAKKLSIENKTDHCITCSCLINGMVIHYVLGGILMLAVTGQESL